MDDPEKSILELKHRMDLRDQDEAHSREENETAHGEILKVATKAHKRIDEHNVRYVEDMKIVNSQLETLTGKDDADTLARVRAARKALIKTLGVIIMMVISAIVGAVLKGVGLI
jgi:hypothetical protein